MAAAYVCVLRNTQAITVRQVNGTFVYMNETLCNNMYNTINFRKFEKKLINYLIGYIE